MIVLEGAGREINFDNENFVISEFAASSISGVHNSSKVLNQHGQTINSTTLDARGAGITGYIIAKDKQDMRRKKSLLVGIVNPLQYVKIKKDGKVLTGKPDATPEFAADYKTGNDNIQKFAVNIICENPFWQNEHETVDMIAKWLPAFYFPAVFPVDQPVMWGYRSPELIINIENKGIEDIGMVIEFQALSDVKNPSILNVVTRENIKINISLNAGDKVTVNTHFGKKSVKKIVDSIEENIFQYLDENANTFLQLHPGENLYSYAADQGVNNLEVRIYRSEQYIDESEG